MTLKQLRRVSSLIPDPIAGWVSLAVVGSVLLAALDTAGVIAMLPLMEIVTTGSTSAGLPAAISSILGTNNVQTVVLAIAGLVAGAFLLKSLFAVAFRWWLLGRTTKLTAIASAEVMRAYVLSPFARHRLRKAPEVYRNITGSVQQAFGQVALGYLTLLADMLTLLALAVVLFVVSPIATAVAVGILGLSSLIIQRMSRAAIVRAGEQVAQSDMDAWAALLPGIDGFREARLTSSANRFVASYLSSKMTSAQAQRKISLLSETPKYALEITFILAIMAMTGVLFSTTSTETALATLGVFAAASLRMLPTLNRATANVAAIRAGSVGLRLLDQALDEFEADGTHSELRRTEARFSGDICLDSVTYAYPDAEFPILAGLSLRIGEGESTALVGSSGAGKSTALDVILGLQFPHSGSVTVGGRRITDDLPSWFSEIGVVPQDVFILNSTLRENVAFGQDRAEVSQDDVSYAIEAARLQELVESLPDGLDTVLGERGVRLSGGQRQRLGIARALYRRPSVLILDEATSALDNLTEREITRTINSLSGQMTVIIVAHRLSTIKAADKIFYLEQGRVTASGNFAELREASSVFDNLVRIGQLN